ncbi:S9 family peptidase [Micrococcus luteus]|uniref:S9 family peptidase n=1 Tax=Micrococcus luteus TaxID=1270 RepID=UPI003627087B
MRINAGDIEKFAHSRRVIGIEVSPSCGRLVLTIAVHGGRGRLVPTLWEYDLLNRGELNLLSSSRMGGRHPAFQGEDEVYFLAPDAESDGEMAVWRCARDGSNEVAHKYPGGINAFTFARDAPVMAFTADVWNSSVGAEENLRIQTERTAKGIDAALYTSGHVRYLSRELGPAEPHLFIQRDEAAECIDLGGIGLGWATGSDITLSADGSMVAYTRNIDGDVPDGNRTVVEVADTVSGEVVVRLDEYASLFYSPMFNGDGTEVICRKEIQGQYDEPPRETIVRCRIASGETTDCLPLGDLWPREVVVATRPGDRRLWFTADSAGHSAVFCISGDGIVKRLTRDGAYQSVSVAPDGSGLFALRSRINEPPELVFIADVEDSTPSPLGDPLYINDSQVCVSNVEAIASDGFPLRAGLLLPDGASVDNPAPLVVLLHGGPHKSWSEWSWEWNPLVFTSRGYAVLLPDPAMSTGYGREMLRRGWTSWGRTAAEDVLSLADAAEQRGDIDELRTTVAGSSFGGLIANRLAAEQDRFRAVISCSGQWNLRTFRSSTDSPWQFERFFEGKDGRMHRYSTESPHTLASRISAPMLVCHGGKDYRVPVEQSLELFHEVRKKGGNVTFLLFPNESHGFASMGNLALRYATMLDFLDEHTK